MKPPTVDVFKVSFIRAFILARAGSAGISTDGTYWAEEAEKAWDQMGHALRRSHHKEPVS